MHFVYSVVFTCGFFLALPYFLLQALLHRKYLSSLSQRLGNLPTRVKAAPEGGIWIHAVSVGEVLASLPLVRALELQLPERGLFLSTTTVTGQILASGRLTGKAQVFYFPLDWRFAVRKSLDAVRPSLVLIAETEIWPNFLRECRKRRVPVLLVNGRISDRSAGRYRLGGVFIKRVLEDFTWFGVQTVTDRARLLGLGASPDKVDVCGNMKYEITAPEGAQEKLEFYRDLLGLETGTFVVVAGSTMKDEEPEVLAAFRRLHSQCSRAVLILAPRHPERFGEVEALISAGGMTCRKRSELRAGDGHSNAAVILLDSLGELALLYALADVVFIGGSLVPTGGHNILEPALYRKPILFGPHMSNFREISHHFLERQAAVQVGSASELGEKLLELSRDAGARQRIGESGYAILTANRGAVQKIVARVKQEVLGAKSAVRTRSPHSHFVL